MKMKKKAKKKQKPVKKQVVSVTCVDSEQATHMLSAPLRTRSLELGHLHSNWATLACGLSRRWSVECTLPTSRTGRIPANIYLDSARGEKMIAQSAISSCWANGQHNGGISCWTWDVHSFFFQQYFYKFYYFPFLFFSFYLLFLYNLHLSFSWKTAMVGGTLI